VKCEIEKGKAREKVSKRRSGPRLKGAGKAIAQGLHEGKPYEKQTGGREKD